MNQQNDIYPLIVMDYYPLKLGNDYSIYMCRNFEEVVKLIILYNEEMGNIIRNISIDTDKKHINYDCADNYFNRYDTTEESDWYTTNRNYETLKIFDNEI